MTDTPGAAPAPAPAPSPEPEAVALPTPISVEPRTAVQDGEVARQAEEAKVKAGEAPPKKVEAKEEVKKLLSTREALAAARVKVEAESATPLKASEGAKAAEPAKDAKAAEPVASKTEPVKAVETPRAADGKFVSADPAKVAEAAAAKVEPAAKEAPKPSHTAEPPPSRFAAEEKEEWDSTPEKVRAGVLRMEKEFRAGFEKYKSGAERDTAHAKWHDMAAKGGTTLDEALTKYTTMEGLLRKPETRDQGIEAIFQNIGISPREWATKLLGTAPDVAAGKQEATITELRGHIQHLEQRLGGIETERTHSKTATTTEAVTKFAADHPRFDELAGDIAFFLQTKHPGDLAKAYEAAERLNPAPQKEAPAAAAPAASSAPSATVTPITAAIPSAASSAAARSIAGAPTAGSDPARKQPSSTIREALRRAQARAG